MQNSWSVQKFLEGSWQHRKAHGVEVRNYSSHHRGMFVLQTDVLVEESCLSPSLCGYCPHSGKDSWALLTLTQAEGTRSMQCTDK